MQPRRARHILVVEDDAPIRELLFDDLDSRGYTIAVAGNGLEALQRLQERRPDAIVLDLMMPGMHGWDFIEAYRAHTFGEVIPIIIVSAAGAVPRSVERHGVRAFLAKPFDLNVLAKHVAAAVGV